MDDAKHSLIGPTAVLLLALALRLAPWGDNRFLEDEALYAAWGLQIATSADPMLDYEPVDKPPLHLYTMALSFLLFGAPLTESDPSSIGRWESAARLPSLFASVTSVALVYALGRQMWGNRRAGLLAALLLALSPFDLLFASTAFTDPLMVALVLGALLAAVRGRLGAAGLLVGLAAAVKQQGLLFLPLVVAVGFLSRPSGREPAKPGRAQRRLARLWRWTAQSSPGSWLRFALAFAAVAGAALWWDSSRLQRPGFWTQGLVSYGSLGPASPEAWGERALDWLQLAGNFWVSPWLNGLLLAAMAAWILVASRLPTARADLILDPRSPGQAATQSAGKIQEPISAVLLVFIIAFFALHWLVTFQVWDRYLLGLVPLVALPAGRALAGFGQAIRSSTGRRVYAGGLGLVLLASLAGPVGQAVRSELPLGGDHGAYDGIDRLAGHVRANVPAGAVLYHHWLGYHYRFYLYGAPLRLHWYPDPTDLVQDATLYRREPRYIAFPSFRDSAPVRDALTDAGIRLAPVYETTRRDGTVSFRLYRLDGP